ncbi:transglutaminase-like domain-containing protein [Ramlibacter albus]|uniref:Transglutaminase family protein n=1 Tax=Ramlibacter albus TaxID=2079448 RepID=A0A923M5G0_9BURK|nr:transglutaminase family protein [Ramlibacter albus]MBC5764176.1 transglutaminase family protein [Ramlibacter albus]
MQNPSPEQCIAPTTLVDSAHPAVVEFARAHAEGATDREKAVSLYYAVRDGFRYDPYRVDLTPDGMRASRVLALGHGWCVTKAALLAAACRAQGIPARLGFADVRNHLSTERMRQTMKTDVFTWHGYADIWLAGAWRKATPAFNVELCDKFGLLPLDFDGENDSIYHPFDRSGNRHMEYLLQRGAYDDVPLAEMRANFEATYPNWNIGLAKEDFAADVERET